jgi:hypothetical protein
MKYEICVGMKKIFVLLIAVMFASSVSAQTTCGALSGNETWSSNVHVTCDVTVGDGIILTISPGVTVSFDAGASLIITGSGSLNANGSSGSKITFTAYGSSWGHIYFNNATATSNSIINYCIIEKGDATSLSPAYGGGIYANTSKLTISNSLIHNNSADWGGGVFVDQSVNPAISNCQFYLNVATQAGGGLYFFQNAYSYVSNCVIFNNSSTGTTWGGGGIFFGSIAGNVQFFNCVIASNSNTMNHSLGDNIFLYQNINATKPSFYNTIVWGSDNSIYYQAQTPASTDFNYCAIQGYTSGYTNCINLSGTNANPAGPNFYNVSSGSEDYRIFFISPCRDIGISSGASSTDYLGKSRIGNYDIGAYEVQYSLWTGVTSNLWATATNWDQSVDPGSGTGDVIIPSGLTNYPTGSSSQNFTIGSGKSMTLNPGAKATFGTLINSGTLKLESNASNISSLILSTFSGNDATIQIYLSGGGNVDDENFKWHYISTPVSSLPVSTFAPGTTLDVAQFIESRPTISLGQGWVAYDKYVYSTGLYNGPSFSTLTPGKGYDYWDNADNTFTFSGALNTSDVVMSLGYSGTPTLSGFNLLGNPFSSGLDWTQIVNDLSYPDSTSKGVYFTRANAQCTFIGGVGIPGDVTGIIPPMQGFFTKTYAAGRSINLLASARVQSNIHARYKGATIIPLVRLSITENSKSDETVVRFDQQAKSTLDNDFDALKMFLSATTTSIYSSMSGTKYAINGQPFPATFVEIPIVVNLVTSGNHTISITQLQGLDNYNVTLIDKTTGFTANLKTTTSLTFSSDTGTITDRLVLKVAYITTGIENPSISKNAFNIYPANNYINIQTMSDTWDGKIGSVKVLDITGKTISNQSNAEFSKDSNIRVPAITAKGIYIVELKSGVMRYVGKVIIR